MPVDILTLSSLQRLTTGRRLWIYRQLAERAKAVKLPRLVKHLKGAVAAEQRARELEGVWRRQRASPPKAEGAAPAEVDVDLDATVVGFEGVLRGMANGSRRREAQRRLAQEVLTTLFPEGVRPITHLPLVEEVSAVEALLARCKAREKDLKKLGLSDWPLQLRELVDDLVAALQRTQPALLNFKDVRAAQDAAQRRLVEALAILLAEHTGDEPEVVAARDAWLAPILEQHEAMRALRLRKARITDIDPDTGEEGDPIEDTDEPTPA